MSETQIQWSGPLAEYFRRMCSCHSHTPCAVPHGALNRLAELEAVHPEPAQAQVSVPVHQLAHEIVRYFSPFMDCGPADAAHEIQIRSLISEALSAPLPDGRLPYGGGIGNG